MPPIPLPRPPLTEGDIRLRPWERRDVKAVTAACQDREIPRWTVVPHRYTERHARDFIHCTGIDLANGRELALAIVDQHDALLGALGLSNFDWGDLKGEIGYWVVAEVRRRGIGSRATRLLANPENRASLRLAERAGFRREGTLRRYRRRHGAREDLVMFSLLAEDLADGVPRR